MGFADSWVETDPDGSIITGSQLDDYMRELKRALRERLEGDAADPLTGLLEVLSFAAAPMPRAGSARAYTGTDAAILALAAAYRQDGRLGISSTNQLYHVATAGVVAVAPGAGNDCVWLSHAGAPVDGGAGTGAGVAGKGSLCSDYTNGELYINRGTKAAPSWIQMFHQEG